MTDSPGDQHVARKSSPGSDRRASTPEAADHVQASRSSRDRTYRVSNTPPLPYDGAPPLPDEPVPGGDDDGWDAIWEPTAQAYYFYNHRTGASQWENPRVPEATAASSYYGSYDRTPATTGSAPGLASTSGAPGTSSPPKRKWGGYNPAIHGSYDPNADYAKEAEKEEEEAEAAAAATAGLPYNSGQDYTATAHFNRFTGKFQQAGQGPELHNDENKSKRQLNAFFDVDAAANSHDGRSLKAERRNKTLSKKELAAVRAKRHKEKEHKRRAWLLE